jgi:hypothetical protein
MNRRTLVMLLLLAVLVATPSAQVDIAPSSIQVRDFFVNSMILDVVHRLAVKCHLVIGVSGTMRDADALPINIEMKNGTLGEALDAVTKADPRFEWRQSNGAILLVTRLAPLALIDVTVHSFRTHHPQSWEIPDLLQDVPEIHDWLQDHKCALGNLRNKADHKPKTWPRFSIHAEGLSLSSILDQIALQSRSSEWDVIQYNAAPCEIGVDFVPRSAPNALMTIITH